jgi:hypothetical protein
MYIAIIHNGGFDYFLRGKVWAFSKDRAFKYESLDKIQEAIETVKPYTKPALRKLIRIEEVTE